MTRIVAVVLAGGQGRRMGGADKALLPFGGATLLDAVLARITPQVEAIAISANGDPARFARFARPVLPDAVPGQGPLAGILAGLVWAAGQGATALLSAPCDTPFLPMDLARRLAPAPACAESGGRLHPLASLWPVSAADRLARSLAAGGSLRVAAFAASLGARAVTFPASDDDAFRNLNDADSLAAADATTRAFGADVAGDAR